MSETNSETSEEVEMSETSSEPCETLNLSNVVIQLKIGDRLSPFKVYKYLVERFGQIEIASFMPGFAFIVFTFYDHVMQVLAEHRIEIEGQSNLVKRADHSNLPYKMYKELREYANFQITPTEVDQLLLQPEDEASLKNIVNFLNEDCVCNILARLTLLDLCSIAKTCKRLNGIAKRVFERKFKKETINLSKLKRNGETMMHIRDLLNNFSSSITSINLCSKIEDGEFNDVVGLLNQQCKNIESLTLNGESIEHFVIDNYIEMFGRLTELNIWFCFGFFPLNRLLAACYRLEKLFVNSEADLNLDLKRVSMPNLVELNLQFCCSDVSVIEEFLMRHPHIETFEFVMKFPPSNRHHNQKNRLIYDHLPNIREIELYVFSDDETPSCSGLKNLKSVEFSFGSNTIAPSMNKSMAQNKPIEKLQLNGGTIDDNAIESICKIATIKEICFFDCSGLDKNKFIRLVGTLPNLKKIHSCSTIEPEEFLDKILPILQKKTIEWSDQYRYISYVS